MWSRNIASLAMLKVDQNKKVKGQNWRNVLYVSKWIFPIIIIITNLQPTGQNPPKWLSYFTNINETIHNDYCRICIHILHLMNVCGICQDCKFSSVQRPLALCKSFFCMKNLLVNLKSLLISKNPLGFFPRFCILQVLYSSILPILINYNYTPLLP